MRPDTDANSKIYKYKYEFSILYIGRAVKNIKGKSNSYVGHLKKKKKNAARPPNTVEIVHVYIYYNIIITAYPIKSVKNNLKIKKKPVVIRCT